MKRLCINFILLIIVLLAIITSCDYDHGLAPLPGKLILTVYFRGTPPENTQGIYPVITPIFPPHAINELFQSPNSLPLDQDTVVTEIDLPFGHYDAYALWWYSKGTESNLADVLTMNLDPRTLLPDSFSITASNPVVRKSLYPDWSRMERDASIEGTIYFNGPFPENTQATAIAAYKYIPQTSIHYLVWLKSMDFSVGPTSRKFFDGAYNYKLPVRHGTVDLVVVYWLPERANLTDFKMLGFYSDPKKPGVPARLSIKTNEIKTGIDIYADWSVIKK